MRLRLVVCAALIAPSLASAQLRHPRGVVNGGPEVAPLGPQPEPIARAERVQRSRVSVESSPIISRVQTPSLALGGVGTSFTTFGEDEHLDYRLTRVFSWTIDLTQSYPISPNVTQTVESGFRFQPKGWESRLRPFVDARLGYAHAYINYIQQGIGIGPAATNGEVARDSRGYGAIAGAGAEYSLTSTFALTSGLYALRNNMVSTDGSLYTAPTPGGSFRMTSYRLALGLKYNRARTITAMQNRQASGELR